MTVLVPFSNASNIGLRRATEDREIWRIHSFLKVQNLPSRMQSPHIPPFRR